MTAETTREFSFPNGGHSIRKLCNSLTDIGNRQVDIVIEEGQYSRQYSEDDMEIVLYFRTSLTGEFNTLKLAKKLKTMGTRFVVNHKWVNYTGKPELMFDLTFHTDWSDIKHNTSFYNVA